MYTAGAVDSHSFSVLVIGSLPAALLLACVVVVAISRTPRWCEAVLNAEKLRRIGKYSYCIYLIHLIPHSFLGHRVVALAAGAPLRLGILIKVLYVAGLFWAVFQIASLSWRYFESKFLALKEKVPYGAVKPETRLVAQTSAV
jgi:peptidoglycan/LPS O-acetylase OafA/YrhL